MTTQQTCETRETLQAEAAHVLQHLIELTQKQIDALAANDQRRLIALDKELELTFGEKERSFGALREHTKAHKC